MIFHGQHRDSIRFAQKFIVNVLAYNQTIIKWILNGFKS